MVDQMKMAPSYICHDWHPQWDQLCTLHNNPKQFLFCINVRHVAYIPYTHQHLMSDCVDDNLDPVWLQFVRPHIEKSSEAWCSKCLQSIGTCRARQLVQFQGDCQNLNTLFVPCPIFRPHYSIRRRPDLWQYLRKIRRKWGKELYVRKTLKKINIVCVCSTLWHVCVESERK